MLDSVDDPAATKTLTATCYCKSVQYSIEVPVSKLPLPVHFCHCSVCRYTHGTLCIFHTALPKGTAPKFIAPSSLDNMTEYIHPKAQAERLFCSTCGCHMGDRGLDESPNPDEGLVPNNEWVIATPLFSEHGEDLFRFTKHFFTEGACRISGKTDQGMFTWLPKIGDVDLNIWNPPKQPSEPQDEGREYNEKGEEVLRAECHCGGVSFTFPRPTHPAVKTDSFLSQYVSPTDPNKWIACLDACNHCRLQNGTLVTAWTFIPRALIEPPMPVALAPYGTLKTYVSSPGVLRAFCGKCGATVIYSCDERTPTPESQVVDVSVGLLRAPEGILADEWVTWRAGRISSFESAKEYSGAFVESLDEAHRKWSVEKYGDAPAFVIP